MTALADDTGSVAERYAYDAYGKAAAYTASWGTPSGGATQYAWQYLHQGLRYNAADKLYDNRARVYSAEYMRLPAERPHRVQGGGSDTYRYESDSPICRIDPSGNGSSLQGCLTSPEMAQTVHRPGHIICRNSRVRGGRGCCWCCRGWCCGSQGRTKVCEAVKVIVRGPRVWPLVDPYPDPWRDPKPKLDWPPPPPPPPSQDKKCCHYKCNDGLPFYQEVFASSSCAPWIGSDDGSGLSCQLDSESPGRCPGNIPRPSPN